MNNLIYVLIFMDRACDENELFKDHPHSHIKVNDENTLGHDRQPIGGLSDVAAYSYGYSSRKRIHFVHTSTKYQDRVCLLAVHRRRLSSRQSG
jgi:hypothetical protein